jgi:alkylhydroperoxidase/carboxymuconolactone decarboxylase family protein YurZ
MSEQTGPHEPPPHYLWFLSKFPDVGRAYESMGTAAHAAGPLDPKTRALIKLGISAAARMEGGVHAQVRKALEEGATEDEIYHAIMLLMPTVGFPTTMATLCWARDILDRPRS